MAVGAAALLLFSCTKRDPWEKGGVAGDTSAALLSVDSGNQLPDRADTTTASDSGASIAGSIDPAFFTAKPLTGKSIGHTSIVFKLGLEGGHDAAYKPRSKVGNERFRAEIAAYRLSRAWGFSNVPAAVFRSFPASSLKPVMDDKASGVFADQVVVEPDGNVRGALIPWISHLEFMPLEKDPDRAKWKGWLEGPELDVGTMRPCDRDLARQISTMIAFDVLTGNWDRWSGGNIGMGVGGSGCTRVLYIDNDGAFFDPVPKLFFDPQVTELKKVRRFSKSFVTALRGTNEDALRAAIGEESPGKPLLPDRVMAAFFERRKLVLGVIDDASKKWGEATALSLP